MSSVKNYLQYRGLRQQALWKLLAADNAPAVLAILQVLFLGENKVMPASAMLERVERELEELRATGGDLSQTAQVYVATWLREGWLLRRLPVGAQEEQYELTSDAVTAIRFLHGVLTPRQLATESRLATVIQQVSQLAEDTNPDAGSRRQALLAERARIDEQLDLLGRGIVHTLPADRALERAREIITLADELAADFRRVREDFEQLHRGLRAELMTNDGSRGEVLEQLFAGMDLIGETDAGKTFNAFWRLLTDLEQAAIFSESLNEVVNRDFIKKLGSAERRFLHRLTDRLMEEGGTVNEVLQTFSRSLRSFVQSRDYLEQRRFNSLLSGAQQAALSAKDQLRTTGKIDFSLWLTSARVRSAAQWTLYDPESRLTEAGMEDAPESSARLEDIALSIHRSEIDFALLRRNIYDQLQVQPSVSLEQLMQTYPATQGLGTVVGYIHLAVRHGHLSGKEVTVGWTGLDNVQRAAKVPAAYFLKDKEREFAR